MFKIVYYSRLAVTLFHKTPIYRKKNVWKSEGLGVHINIRSVVEFQRWWFLKSKLFDQESTCHQGKIFKKFLRVMTVCQKVPKSYFQSQFWMSKIDRIFSKNNLSKNINLGDHY